MRKLKSIVDVILLVVLILFAVPSVAYANNFEDYIVQDNSEVQNTDSTSEAIKSDSGNRVDNSSVADYLRSYKPISEENMQQAVKQTSWFRLIVGNALGLLSIGLVGAQVLISGIDLIYLTIPAVREYLDGSVVALSGGGAVQEGFGMQPGVMHQPNAAANGGRKKQIVSDEAIKALSLAGSGSLQGARAMNGGSLSGGFGFNRSYGMGGGYGMGGYGMGSPMMGAQGQDQIVPNKKLAIAIYFKMRSIALVFIFVALTVLTSSIFMDCGVNIAELIFKIYNNIRSAI